MIGLSSPIFQIKCFFRDSSQYCKSPATAGIAKQLSHRCRNLAMTWTTQNSCFWRDFQDWPLSNITNLTDDYVLWRYHQHRLLGHFQTSSIFHIITFADEISSNAYLVTLLYDRGFQTVGLDSDWTFNSGRKMCKFIDDDVMMYQKNSPFNWSLLCTLILRFGDSHKNVNSTIKSVKIWGWTK